MVHSNLACSFARKIKRMKKIEKAKEEQDKIRLGLMAAPEPKSIFNLRVVSPSSNFRVFIHVFSAVIKFDESFG